MTPLQLAEDAAAVCDAYQYLVGDIEDEATALLEHIRLDVARHLPEVPTGPPASAWEARTPPSERSQLLARLRAALGSGWQWLPEDMRLSADGISFTDDDNDECLPKISWAEFYDAPGARATAIAGHLAEAQRLIQERAAKADEDRIKQAALAASRYPDLLQLKP